MGGGDFLNKAKQKWVCGFRHLAVIVALQLLDFTMRVTGDQHHAPEVGVSS
jgi:hypothetical protein